MISLQKIDDALDYIEKNLTQTISFEEIAKIAYCSTFTFQRMFSYLTGMPLSEYIRRRRMSAAAFDLQNSKEKIADISLKYGYQSPTSFTRAFQTIHGISPSAVGKDNNFITTYPRLKLNIAMTGDEKVTYRIERKPAMRLLGFKRSLTTNFEKNILTVPKFWEETKRNSDFKTLQTLMNQKPIAMLGATLYTTDTIDYLIGVASNLPCPSQMPEVTIPETTWLILQCIGPMPDAFKDLYSRFFTQWLPVSDYVYDKGPDIELYTQKDASKTNHSCELWLGIKKKRGT